MLKRIAINTALITLIIGGATIASIGIVTSIEYPWAIIGVPLGISMLALSLELT